MKVLEIVYPGVILFIAGEKVEIKSEQKGVIFLNQRKGIEVIPTEP